MADPFPTTRWSLVLHAGDSTSTSREALSKLCEIYWFPLYAYVRRRGHSADDARDLVQSYFAEMLERGSIDSVQPDAGRFRAFLLHTVKLFLIDDGRRQRAKKRGDGRSLLQFDLEAGEGRYSASFLDTHSPDREFDRQWALTVIERVLERLENEAERNGRQSEFRRLRPFLTDAVERGSYTAVAAEQRTSEGAVKVAVHRLRRRFGQYLREEIADTVTDPDEVDDEIRYMFAALDS